MWQGKFFSPLRIHSSMCSQKLAQISGCFPHTLQTSDHMSLLWMNFSRRRRKFSPVRFVERSRTQKGLWNAIWYPTESASCAINVEKALRQRSLVDHTIATHPTVKRFPKYSYNQCGKLKATKNVLKSHMMWHTNSFQSPNYGIIRKSSKNLASFYLKHCSEECSLASNLAIP